LTNAKASEKVWDGTKRDGGVDLVCELSTTSWYEGILITTELFLFWLFWFSSSFSIFLFFARTTQTRWSREFVFLKIECDVSVKWVCIWAYLILGLLRKLFFTPPLCSRWNSPHNLTICGNTTSIAFIKARSLSVKIIQQITNNISKKSQTTNS
jgi:hypothetical protein